MATRRNPTRARGASRTNQARFARNMAPRVPRSSFNRSKRLSTTLDEAGKLYPVYVDNDILPGDTVRMQMASLVRLATPLHPILDELVVDFHWFFVPYRIVWDNALAFFGEQTDLDNPTSYVIPTTTSGASTHVVGSLWDYMGLPIVGSGLVHSALPHRAYYKIWNDWYRPQELSPMLFRGNTGDGPDSASLFQILDRYRRHDYFSSALISPQRGADVDIPIGGIVPVETDTTTPTFSSTGGVTNQPLNYVQVVTHPSTLTLGAAADGTSRATQFGDNTGLQVDLASVSNITVNAWREAITLQQFLEAEARGGSRYAELVDTMFGVNFPDRLYRPEYLGGFTTQIQVTQVPQTSNTVTGTDASPQGNLAAFAQGGGVSRPWTKSFVEHGTLMCLASARRAQVTYQQGMHRMWSRQTRFDHYWPMFANLGEDAILSKEIYATGTPGVNDDDKVFGYQERWAEYKYAITNQVTGKMRSAATSSLDTWHLADDYSTRPELNLSWMREDPPIDRIIAVTTEPHFLAEVVYSAEYTRCMPVSGVPGLRRM